ncbi:MAG: hypothetical protein V2A54_07660 [Bacteroidota bacterium]
MKNEFDLLKPKHFLTSILLALASFPLSAQNYGFRLAASRTNFAEVNGKPLDFNGVTIEGEMVDKVGVSTHIGIYSKQSYDGVVRVFSFFTSDSGYIYIPTKLTGGAFDLEFNFKAKIYSSRSQNFSSYAKVGLNNFFHTADFNSQPINLTYPLSIIYGANILQFSLITGLGAQFRIFQIPFFIELNKFIKIDETANTTWSYSVPFLKRTTIKAGINLPILTGPSPKRYKKITFE